MASAQWVIIEGGPWRIARLADDPQWQRVDLPDPAPPAEAAPLLADALRAAGYRGEDLLLGLASASCLAGAVDLSGLARRPDRQTLLYQFETALPVAAEDVVADFVLDRSAAFGVAAPVETLRPLVEGLEAEGIHVLSVTPWSLLAARAVLNSRRGRVPRVVPRSPDRGTRTDRSLLDARGRPSVTGVVGSGDPTTTTRNPTTTGGTGVVGSGDPTHDEGRDLNEAHWDVLVWGAGERFEVDVGPAVPAFP